jgi:hypothetical protein
VKIPASFGSLILNKEPPFSSELLIYLFCWQFRIAASSSEIINFFYANLTHSYHFISVKIFISDSTADTLLLQDKPRRVFCVHLHKRCSLRIPDKSWHVTQIFEFILYFSTDNVTSRPKTAYFTTKVVPRCTHNIREESQFFKAVIFDICGSTGPKLVTWGTFDSSSVGQKQCFLFNLFYSCLSGSKLEPLETCLR